MPIDPTAPLALFLFAHQDDEFGVFHQIERERAAGRIPYCVYVTDGGATADPARRDDESRRVLEALGVREDEIAFLGGPLGIPDGRLHTRVAALAEFLTRFAEAHPQLAVCYVPAWEGGHPDHDILHAVSLVTFSRLRPQVEILQYPLYNSRGVPGPLFRVLSPLPENGAVLIDKISASSRLKYLRLCLGYPSQWKTWAGLLPFVASAYLTRPHQHLQRTDRARLVQRPHPGTLYYERRRFLDWETLAGALGPLLSGPL